MIQLESSGGAQSSSLAWGAGSPLACQTPNGPSARTGQSYARRTVVRLRRRAPAKPSLRAHPRPPRAAAASCAAVVSRSAPCQIARRDLRRDPTKVRGEGRDAASSRAPPCQIASAQRRRQPWACPAWRMARHPPEHPSRGAPIPCAGEAVGGRLRLASGAASSGSCASEMMSSMSRGGVVSGGCRAPMAAAPSMAAAALSMSKDEDDADARTERVASCFPFFPICF